MVKKGFVKIYNVFTDVESEYFLDMKEMYVYSYLRMLQSKSNDLLINIDFLHSVMTVQFEGNITRNKKQISSTVKSLINKNIIKCDKNDFNNKDRLLINFDDKKFGNGHEQVECSFIDELEEYQYLYIYAVVVRRRNTNKGYLEFSYTDWSNLLGTHRSTAIQYVKDCVDKEIIYCEEGGYNGRMIEGRGQMKQDKNKYKNTPFDTTEYNGKKPKVKGDKEDNSNDTGNWETSNNLEESDFDIYVNADSKQKKRWDKRIEGIKNGGEKGLWIYENKLKPWMEKAKQRHKNEKLEHINRKYMELASQAVTQMVIYDKDKDIRTPIDVAVLVDDDIKLYKDCDQDVNVDVMFYEEYEYINGVGEYNPELKYIINPSIQQIEWYRPCNNNGDWRNKDNDILYSDVETVDPNDVNPDDYDEEILSKEF